MQPNFGGFSFSFFFRPFIFSQISHDCCCFFFFQLVPLLYCDPCCPKDPSPDVTPLAASLCPHAPVPAFGCSPASSWLGTIAQLCLSRSCAPAGLAQPLARWAVLPQSLSLGTHVVPGELQMCRTTGCSWQQHPAIVCSIQHCNAWM